MRRKTVAGSLVALIALGIVWLLFMYYRTGITVTVYLDRGGGKTDGIAVESAQVAVWREDSLVQRTSTNSKGYGHFRLDPGAYDVTINAEGLLSTRESKQRVALFQTTSIQVELSEPFNSGSERAVEQAIDTTSVITRASKDDVWRVWKNRTTGMPHRVVGSAIRLPSAPRNKRQAVQMAKQVLRKYIEDNKDKMSVLAEIDLSTLHPLPVRRFKNKWIVVFGQRISHVAAEGGVPVFGGEASVTISGRRVIQFGLDVFPNVVVSEQSATLKKRSVATSLLEAEGLQSVDTTSIAVVVFPEPDKQAGKFFRYKLAYECYATKLIDSELQVWKYVADAATGRTLYSQNLSMNMRAGRVKAAMLEKSPEESEPELIRWRYGQIGNETIGFVPFGRDGSFSFKSDATLEDVHIKLGNPYFSIVKTSLLSEMAFMLASRPPSASIYAKPAIELTRTTSNGVTELKLSEVVAQFNALAHVHRVRDYFLKRGIGDWLDSHLHVFIFPNYRNASYHPHLGQGEALIFGSISDPLALRSDVIYHEYVHGVVNWIVSKDTPGPDPLPYQNEPGAINEGLADYYACALNGDPEVRIANPLTPFGREHNRLLENDLTYQEHLKVGAEDHGYVHYNSKIFSGILWDLRKLMVAKKGNKGNGGAYSDELILEALLIPPVPQTFSDFAINLLLADDTDNRLFTGTPNFTEIQQAFVNHGIDIPPFELNQPTIHRLDLTTNPPSNPKHIEEGFELRVRATISESGYGLDADKIRLVVNDREMEPSSLRIRRYGRTFRIRSVLGPARQGQFGKTVRAVLSAEDLAGNITVANISKPIKDTAAPEYELQDCSLKQNTLFVKVKVTDVGSGVDASSVRVRVNGNNIDGLTVEEVNERDYYLSMEYPYQPGNYSIEGEISDNAGNVTKVQEDVNQLCLSPCILTTSSFIMGLFAMHRRRKIDGIENYQEKRNASI